MNRHPGTISIWWTLPEKATNHVLEQPHSLLLDQLRDHVAQDRPHSVESFVCMTDVCKPDIVQQYLLHDEYRYGLAKLRARLHNTQAKRDDLGGQEKVDYVR